MNIIDDLMSKSAKEAEEGLMKEIFSSKTVCNSAPPKESLDMAKLSDLIKEMQIPRYNYFRDFMTPKLYLEPISFKVSEEVSRPFRVPWDMGIAIHKPEALTLITSCTDYMEFEFEKLLTELPYEFCRAKLLAKGRKKLRGKKIKKILAYFMQYERIMEIPPTFKVKRWRLTLLKRRN